MNRNGQTGTLCFQRLVEIALHIVRESQVIPDVELERTRGKVQPIRQSIGLHSVRLACRELHATSEIGDRVVGLPHG